MVLVLKILVQKKRVQSYKHKKCEIQSGQIQAIFTWKKW